VNWAKEGACVLLSVELDSPSAEEPPRVTIRGAQALADVKAAAKMSLTLDVALPEAFSALAAVLPRGGTGTVEVVLKTGAEKEPRLRLGRDFALDGDLAELIAGLDGVANVSLKAARGGHLRLVA